MSWSGWGTHVDIAVPPGGNGSLPEWSELKFNPLGLYNLRRRLGALKCKAGIFMRYKDRFLQSDIAWFTAGLHNDGQHITSRDTYHPLFLTAREHTGTGEPANKLWNKLRDAVRDHVFDTATLWDRAYGGCTMVLHVDGTTIPNVPALPEYLKAHVYLPPNLVGEFTDSHGPIANIVQSFIEAIGVPTVMRWRRAASNNNWSLTQPPSGGLPAPSAPNLPLIPHPTLPTSLYYIFPGRPYGSLYVDGQPSSPDTSQSSPPSEAGQSFMEPDIDHGPGWDAVLEENVQLNEELREARDRVAEQEGIIASLREEIRNFMARQEKRGHGESSAHPAAPATHSGGSSSRLHNLKLGSNIRQFPSASQMRTIPSPSQQLPSLSPTRESHPRNPIYQTPTLPSKLHFWTNSSPAQAPLLESSSSRMMGCPIFAGAIQSFGSSCEAFIEENNLRDILHSQLYELFNFTLPAKWHQEILGWFVNYDKSTALALANSLYDAMYADAVTRSVQEQQ